MSIGSLVISILSHHQIWYHLSHRYWSLLLSLVARPEMEVSPGFVFKKSLVTCKSGHLGAEQPWRHFPPGAVQSGRRRSTARPGNEHLSDSDSNADVGCTQTQIPTNASEIDKLPRKASQEKICTCQMLQLLSSHAAFAASRNQSKWMGDSRCNLEPWRRHEAS